jgi:hypothetical protein
MCLLISFAQARATDDLVVAPALPPGSALGSYTGTERIALGEVRDETFSQSAAHIGMGPQAAYEIMVEGSRAEFVKKGVIEALRSTGLLAGDPATTAHILDVTILRNRFHVHQTFGRFRLRTEVFLMLAFRKEDIAEGRVLACGNAETYAQFASKKKASETYQAGFNDAVHKLLNSKTLVRVLGGGWNPTPAPSTSGEYDTTRIHKDEFYGPTDVIQAEVEKASTPVQTAGPFERVVLPDFTVQEVVGKKKDELQNLQLARAFVPEKTREHLNAFFPGAFKSIERNGAAGAASSLVVDGKLDKFRIGSLTARIMVGFGAGKDKIEGQISIHDGSGRILNDISVLSSNWGAGWQMKQGQIRDMADQLARDLAYFLVRTAAPGYKPPEDLEVLFDDTPYPMKPRKS